MVKRGLAVAVVCVLVSSIASAQRTRAARKPPQPGDALPGMTAAERERFGVGRLQFLTPEQVEAGLGPVFNESSCVKCHANPAVGGTSGQTVSRIGTTTTDGKFDSLNRLGGPTLQAKALGPNDTAHRFQAEVAPPEATIVVRRQSPALFGLGVVDAAPDSTFIALAQQEAARGDGTAGRPNMVGNIVAGMKTVGKFGWKAQTATLFEFSGDALLNELGITNPLFPNENCPSGNCAELAFNPLPGLNDDGRRLNALFEFMKFLGPPPRTLISADAAAGEVLFSQVGCDSCHVATLQTGPNSSAALDRVTYHPYSDFLLHDMGALGDRVEQGSATGREMRTATLWGQSLRGGHWLHDGRARSLEDSILLHDGQGKAARDRFLSLPEADRTKVIAFMQSL